MKKNKWATMVIEWAMTSKPVQVNKYGSWEDDPHPTWRDEFQYRFKTEVIRSRRYIFLMDGEYQVATVMDEHGIECAEASDYFVRWVDCDWVEHQV